MKQVNHDELIQLNERLDTILTSDKALEAAAKSKSSVFRAAAELTKAEHPQVDAAMRERMRARMLQAVPESKTPGKKPILYPNFAELAARVAGIVLVLLFIGLMTPPALANSLPGDALYPAKRGLETVELVFAGDALHQVQVHFSHSERRIDESERLMAKGRFDSDVMEDALSSLESAIRIANDNNLFEQDAALEAHSNAILIEFNQTLDTAEAEQLISSEDVVRLDSDQEALMAFLPARMEEPSNSSEVTSTESPTIEVLATASQIPLEASETSEPPTEEAYVSLDDTIVYVNAEGNVNVREGAGTAYAVIARISSSSELTAIGTAGDWTQVRLEDGRVGWIANFLLSDTPPVPTQAVSTETPITGGGDTTTGSSTGSAATGGTNTNNSDCERGRSCGAPGQNNGNGGGGNGNSSGNNGND